jgi:hypothetical protein
MNDLQDEPCKDCGALQDHDKCFCEAKKEEGGRSMKFKSMSPKGYLDCKEYQPGGNLFAYVDIPTLVELDRTEVCGLCGYSAGEHSMGECIYVGGEPGSASTPTPLRGRGRPHKVVSSSSDEGEEIEKEEEQTYYYGDNFVFHQKEMGNFYQDPETIIGVTWVGEELCMVWHTGKASSWNKHEKRTADELFSDPSFELYGGPDEE